ncbi:hypothetical protein MMC31_001212 [Peltigera leucophlebia]|nr:hypothetical protein [Peltigera leucophlebia]
MPTRLAMEELGILDQLPFMNFYSQMTACFPLSKGTNEADLVADLELGLQTLIGIFPFLDKKVIHVQDIENDDITSGTYKLISREEGDPPILRINKVDGPSYEKISKLQAPASLLDSKVFAPMKSIPETCAFISPEPVLVIQANFVPGGLLLSFAGMHNVFDGNALGDLIRHFATTCRGDQISDADIKAGNLIRPGLIPTLAPGESSQDHSIIHRHVEHDPRSIEDMRPAPWNYFRFSAAKIAELKKEASKPSAVSSPPPWISTIDALSALIWKACISTRLPRLDPKLTSTLVRAINARRFYRPPIPSSYMGVCIVGDFPVLPLSDLTKSLSIADIATVLRKALNEIDDHHVRSFASFVKLEPDKRNITFSVPNPDRDMMISSWASLPIYTSDFGTRLGKPEYVRRPTCAPCDGLVFIMPKNLDGDYDVAVSLREDDLHRLKHDPTWTAYADLIG